MKNVILGVALVAFAFGCKTDKQAAISDASAPGADCASACSSEAKSECSTMEKSECSSEKVCPVTGKVSE